uniref:Uncharacterized protein n=1 Tax=Arundo donax TaxID=35708 RepID=A0A0A9HSK5_ARUDO
MTLEYMRDQKLTEQTAWQF